MKCKDCKYFRTDMGNYIGKAAVPARYGNVVYPCNRYPMNIMRAPDEPQCGEFVEQKLN